MFVSYFLIIHKKYIKYFCKKERYRFVLINKGCPILNNLKRGKYKNEIWRVSRGVYCEI